MSLRSLQRIITNLGVKLKNNRLVLKFKKQTHKLLYEFLPAAITFYNPFGDLIYRIEK